MILNMKNAILLAAAVSFAAVTGCQEYKYEFDTDFTVPEELVTVPTVQLDVTSSEKVVLSWNGGGAADGGIVLYNVLFDKEGGDFSSPLATMPSDLGAGTTLTLTHAQVNTLAREAGIKPMETGSFIWTVTASKGGVVKMVGSSAELKVIRGEGIDNIPQTLFISGSAALEPGQEFRRSENGLFVIYTEIGAGDLKFSSEENGGYTFYANGSGKLNEGDGKLAIAEAPETGLARITVNFNTLNCTIEPVGKSVRAIWGATFSNIAVLEYAGDGNFKGDGEIVFLGPGREGTPDWCSWVEERYYFLAKVNGGDVCWGSSYGSAATPDGTDGFFDIYEYPWSQWEHLWKMDHALDLQNADFTIWTNKQGKMTHSIVKK